MQIQINVTVEENESSVDEIWSGSGSIEGNDFVWYATTSKIIINDQEHEWPEHISNVQGAITATAFNQLGHRFLNDI